jgi:hypothetical protein
MNTFLSEARRDRLAAALGEIIPDRDLVIAMASLRDDPAYIDRCMLHYVGLLRQHVKEATEIGAMAETEWLVIDQYLSVDLAMLLTYREECLERNVLPGFTAWMAASMKLVVLQ